MKIILAIGVFQGVFLAALISFQKKKDTRTTIYIRSLLIAISWILLEFLLLLSGGISHCTYLFASSYPLLFLLGPLYYLYFKTSITQSRYPYKKTALHFIPCLLYTLFLIPFYLQTPEQKADYISDMLKFEVIHIPPLQMIWSIINIVQLFIYIVLTIRLMSRHEKRLKNNFSFTGIVHISWLKKMIIFFSLFLSIYFIMFLLLFFLDLYGIIIDCIITLFLSVFIHLAAVNSFKWREITAKTVIIEPVQDKYRTSPLTSKESQNYLTKLKHIMESETPYLNSELKLSDLAEQLALPAYQLSQIINQELKVNFFDFVNKYRVNAVKERLLNPLYKNYKFLAIAYDVGFNNKGTFNRVFKKHTGMTPSEFMLKAK